MENPSGAMMKPMDIRFVLEIGKSIPPFRRLSPRTLLSGGL